MRWGIVTLAGRCGMTGWARLVTLYNQGRPWAARAEASLLTGQTTCARTRSRPLKPRLVPVTEDNDGEQMTRVFCLSDEGSLLEPSPRVV